MALIVSVFKSTDYGGGSSYKFRYFSLCQTCLCAEFINLPCDFRVSPLFLQQSQSFRAALKVSAMENFNSVRCWFLFLSHDQNSSNVWRFGSRPNFFFRRVAFLISIGGIILSLTRPCETTAAVVP